MGSTFVATRPGPDEGGKRAFVSSLRKTRFDVAVLVWSGARSRTHRAMQAVSVVSGARKKLVYGAHGEPFRLAPRGMKSIAAHGFETGERGEVLTRNGTRRDAVVLACDHRRGRGCFRADVVLVDPRASSACAAASFLGRLIGEDPFRSRRMG